MGTILRKGEKYMLKFMAKIAEKYEKSTKKACIILEIIHQHKMHASLKKKYK